MLGIFQSRPALALLFSTLIASTGQNSHADEPAEALPRLPIPSRITHAISVLDAAPKYAEDEPFSFVNPDAPKVGKVRLVGHYFTKLSEFGLYGTPPPLLHFLVFQQLADKSWDDDEAYTVYGVLVHYFEIADDRSRIRLHLRRNATFSDGAPVTARDVVFSYRLLFKPDINPATRGWFRGIDRMEEVDKYTVDIWVGEYSRELPVNLSRLTIYPEHVYGEPGTDLARDFDDVLPIGSGPYVIEAYEKGQDITYLRRDPFWGDEVPRLRGTKNFGRVHFQVYYDDFSIIQALKSGLIDFMGVDASAYRNQMTGVYFDKGFIRKERLPITRPAAMNCFIFNLRQPIFQDVRIRQAISLLYDFDAVNRNLFWGDYERLDSYFHKEENLRSKPGPATGEVREIILDLAERHNVPEEDRIYVPALALERGAIEYGLDSEGQRIPMEKRILAVNLLFDKLGWRFDERAGVRKRGDQELQLEILTDGTQPQELQYLVENMRAVGIRPVPVQASALELVNRRNAFRFDMTSAWFDGRRAPSMELAHHFLSDGASVIGSLNLLGIENPAIDEVLNHMIHTDDLSEIEIWARVFDRIMLANTYVIPRAWPRYNYGVYWDYLAQPEEYASGLWFSAIPLRYWWMDEARKEEIEREIAEGQAN